MTIWHARLRVTERGNVRSGFFFGTLLRGFVCELLQPPSALLATLLILFW